MANDAIINFLFNSQGAMREIENFKTSFGRAIDGIKESSIGKFTAIGGALASAFSIKSFVDYTKAMTDFNVIWSDMPIEKVSKFANLMELLNNKATYDETISALGALQGKLRELKTSPTSMPLAWARLGITTQENGRYKNALEIMDEVIIKYREFQKNMPENKRLSDVETTAMLQQMGLSQPMIVAMKKRMNQSEDAFEEYSQKVGKMRVVKKDDIETINKFQESITMLKNAFRGFGQTLLEEGFVTNVINKLTDIINAFNKLPDETKDKILGIAGALSAIGPALKLLGGAMGLLNPFVLLIGLIAVCASGLIDFKDIIGLIQKGWDAFINSIKDEFPTITAFFEGFADILGKLKDRWNAFIQGQKMKVAIQASEDFNKGVNLTEQMRKFKLESSAYAKRLKDKEAGRDTLYTMYTPTEKQTNNEIKNTVAPTISITVEGNADEQALREMPDKIMGRLNQFIPLVQQLSGVNSGANR